MKKYYSFNLSLKLANPAKGFTASSVSGFMPSGADNTGSITIPSFRGKSFKFNDMDSIVKSKRLISSGIPSALASNSSSEVKFSSCLSMSAK